MRGRASCAGPTSSGLRVDQPRWPAGERTTREARTRERPVPRRTGSWRVLHVDGAREAQDRTSGQSLRLAPRVVKAMAAGRRCADASLTRADRWAHDRPALAPTDDRRVIMPRFIVLAVL